MNTFEDQKAAVLRHLRAIIDKRRAPALQVRQLRAWSFPKSGFISLSVSPSVPVSIVTPVKPETLFRSIGLDITDPLEICEELAERLGIPKIHSNFVRQIPTASDIQDSMPPLNKSADLSLTLDQFAGKIARSLTN